MIRAYDDYGNVVDLVEWEKQIRADAIDEVFEWLKTKDIRLKDVYLSELKEQKNEGNPT